VQAYDNHHPNVGPEPVAQPAAPPAAVRPNIYDRLTGQAPAYVGSDGPDGTTEAAAAGQEWASAATRNLEISLDIVERANRWQIDPTILAGRLDTDIERGNRRPLRFLAHKKTEIEGESDPKDRTAEQWLWWHMGARATDALVQSFTLKMQNIAEQARKRFDHSPEEVEALRLIGTTVLRTVVDRDAQKNSSRPNSLNQAVDQSLRRAFGLLRKTPPTKPGQ